ncbi:MAG: hypothetical protein ACLQPH_10295 [Acidimicrobiales bacterium]
MDTRYAVAGLSIDVSCTDATVSELVASRLRPLRAVPDGRADISVEIVGPEEARQSLAAPTGTGRPVYDAPGRPIEYFDRSDELYVDFEGQVTLRCEPSKGIIRIVVTGTDPADRVTAAHPLLTVALLETVTRFGVFPLHAACLSLDGRGVLVPGSSGSGKSTLSVTLVRAGFEFLSDDTVFLTGHAASIRVSGFPDEVDVTGHTVSMFPELSYLAGTPLRPGREKYSFRVEDVFGVSAVRHCEPVALVFPRVGGRPSPLLEPLAPAEALFELTPNLLLTEPVATQAHLDMVGGLVRGVPSYAFRPGPDPDAAAACIAELMTR